MENHIELYILGLLGVLVHYLKDWTIHQNKGLKYGWEKAVPTFILSVVTTAILVYLRDSIKDLYVITPFSALVIGYMGNSIFFSFVDAKKPVTDKP
jgi:hypothetical protein